MTTEEKTIKREVKLPFIGVKTQTVVLEKVDFESWKEAMGKINEMSEEEQVLALKDFNDGRFSKIRSDAYAKIGGTGRNSIVSAVKKIIGAYKVANPDAPDEEAATFVLENVPNIKNKLQEAGIDLSENKSEDSDDSDVEEVESVE